MSHVVVIDSTARRAVVKTAASTYLSDVLQEACSKLGLNASQYGLKHSGKQVDLSRTYRLAGLPSGAKLELVQLSRSASVVTVALQLPESEARGAPSGRLTDKFPSTTTLWLVLRKFEAGVAGEAGIKRNLTARGTPSTTQGDSEAGRLYYERPVLQIMGRELSSFTDLQKTLGQLGFNSGNTLLRLSFRASDTPLEEAMVEIEQYFQSVEGESGPVSDSAASQSTQTPEVPQITQDIENIQPMETSPLSPPQDPMPIDPPQETTQPSLSPLASPTITTSSGRPLTVLAPSTSNTPQAALQRHNENDYEPTIAVMKVHQSRIVASSRPQRLPTDAEIAAQDQATLDKLSAVKSVNLAFRFPDQNRVEAMFTNDETGSTVYDFVKSCLIRPNEPFQLTTPNAKGVPTLIPDSGKRLIQDLRLKGGVLLTFSWLENATIEARTAQFTVNEDLRKVAKKMEVKEPDAVEENDMGPVERSRGGGNDGKKKGLPKWLKLPGKK